MKFAMINGSPRTNSASEFILNYVKDKLPAESEILHIDTVTPLSPETVSQILLCDCIVIASPLYIDALPSSLLDAMDKICNVSGNRRANRISVYAVINCAFYESHNNHHALEIIENWSKHCGFDWKRGVGIGAGGFLLMGSTQNVEEVGKKNIWTFVRVVARTFFSYDNPFRKKPFAKGFNFTMQSLADDIVGNTGNGNVYIRPYFPKITVLYNLMTNFSFILMIKSNGLKIKDIGRKDL